MWYCLDMQRRKVTCKLYPNASQLERLDGWVRLHAELYNTALQRTGVADESSDDSSAILS